MIQTAKENTDKLDFIKIINILHYSQNEEAA